MNWLGPCLAVDLWGLRRSGVAPATGSFTPRAAESVRPQLRGFRFGFWDDFVDGGGRLVGLVAALGDPILDVLGLLGAFLFSRECHCHFLLRSLGGQLKANDPRHELRGFRFRPLLSFIEVQSAILVSLSVIPFLPFSFSFPVHSTPTLTPTPHPTSVHAPFHHSRHGSFSRMPNAARLGIPRRGIEGFLPFAGCGSKLSHQVLVHVSIYF